jgi:hypothetical protein
MRPFRAASGPLLRQRYDKVTLVVRADSQLVFLAGDRKEQREDRVRRYTASDPGVALLLAAVNFEWTVCRAVLFLSRSPNAELRIQMGKFYSLDAYKELWKTEVVLARQLKPLTDVVRNWSLVRGAFTARNRLVHGRDRYTRNMAVPHIESLLKGAGYIDDYCESLGLPLYDRMPVRRKAARA